MVTLQTAHTAPQPSTTAISLPPDVPRTAENCPLLQRMPLFAHVPDEAVSALAAIATQVSVDAATALFRDGDPGDKVYFVCSGEVEISLTNAAKSKITLETEKDGDFFGEVGALSGSIRTATAHSLRKTNMLVVGGNDLKRVLREHPDIMLAMYAQTARRLGRTSVDLRRTNVADAAQLFQAKMSERERQIRAVAQFCGSLKMLGMNALFVAAWAAVVCAFGKNPFDGIAFNVLALVLTLEAIAITCIVLHSQNLQEERETFIKKTETEANIRTELMVKSMDEKLNALRSELLLRLPIPTVIDVPAVLPAEKENTP